MSLTDYPVIARHYENCFAQHGDTPRGMDWPNTQDAQTRYQVMLDVVPPGQAATMLDVGCGTGHLLAYLRKQAVDKLLDYAGLDISTQFIQVCQQKFTDVSFFAVDVLKDTHFNYPADYLMLNGVFTEKVSLPYADMLDYWQQMLLRLYSMCRKGLAFNVMSSHVDWERDDLFHLPMDDMARFVYKHLSRHVVIRNDYGLYEYTVYIYREAQRHG